MVNWIQGHNEAFGFKALVCQSLSICPSLASFSLRWHASCRLPRLDQATTAFSPPRTPTTRLMSSTSSNAKMGTSPLGKIGRFTSNGTRRTTFLSGLLRSSSFTVARVSHSLALLSFRG